MRVVFVQSIPGLIFSAVGDNRALSQASEVAAKAGVPLLVLFILSPQDYVAHDRSARRIDFTLRNLAVLKVSYIPSYDMNGLPTDMYHLSENVGGARHPHSHLVP